MYRFWEKPKTDQGRRSIYIVRSVNPLWAFNYIIGNNEPVSDLREELSYILGHLDMQIPAGPVLIVDSRADGTVHTIDAIKGRLDSRELEVHSDWAVPVNAPIEAWLNWISMCTKNTEPDVTIVSVVDQLTFDKWCKELALAQSLDEPSTILRAFSDKKDRVDCLA